MAYSRLAVKMEGGEEILKAIRDAGLNARKVNTAAAKKGATVIADAARSNAPKSRVPGKRVTASVTKRAKDHVTVSIGPTKKHWYLKFAETGTTRHEIRGKPFLRFFRGGQLVEVRQVTHPGTPARPFLRPAADANGQRAIDTAGEVFKDAVEKARLAAEGRDEG